jgi:DNA-binding HxlR family transcriptional regulator
MSEKSSAKPIRTRSSGNPAAPRCSIAASAKLLADGWTILILRELFAGERRFDAIAQNTGAASNILADRLARMAETGLLTRRDDPDDGRRVVYALTEMGLATFPILMALMAFGDEHLAGGKPSVTLTHNACGAITRPGTTCSNCGAALEMKALSVGWGKTLGVMRRKVNASQ